MWGHAHARASACVCVHMCVCVCRGMFSHSFWCHQRPTKNQHFHGFWKTHDGRINGPTDQWSDGRTDRWTVGQILKRMTPAFASQWLNERHLLSIRDKSSKREKATFFRKKSLRCSLSRNVWIAQAWKRIMIETYGWRIPRKLFLARILNYKLAQFDWKTRALSLKMSAWAARKNFTK